MVLDKLIVGIVTINNELVFLIVCNIGELKFCFLLKKVLFVLLLFICN